ncbi:hypothetical protein FN846DRAFT_915879 [Sphaerosporella brunnea]|uniref:Uncharacterized protein n=1 Tax=Sphaerosporella brunnea TaxID=1250544 RepID=A0A5J5F9N4_9PEZI|nr:hypothetical protein FN846DRAFT_915879 [Sphaerosporella brunnea]
MSHRPEPLALAATSLDRDKAQFSPTEESTIFEYLDIVKDIPVKDTQNLRADQCLAILTDPDWNRIELLLLNAKSSISPPDALNEALSLLNDVEFARYCAAYIDHKAMTRANRDALTCVLGARHDLLLESSVQYRQGIAHLEDIGKIFEKARSRHKEELQRRRRDEVTIATHWGADWLEKVTKGHSFELSTSRNTRDLIKKFIGSGKGNVLLFSQYLEQALAARLEANATNLKRGGHRKKMAGPADVRTAIALMQEVRQSSFAAPTSDASPTPGSPERQGNLSRQSSFATPTSDASPTPCSPEQQENLSRQSAFATPTSDASPTPGSQERQGNLSESPALAEALGNVDRAVESLRVYLGADAQTGHIEIGDRNAAVDTPGTKRNAVEGQVDPATSETECRVDPATSGAERQVDPATSGAERQVDPATGEAEGQDTSTSLSADVEPSGTIEMTSTGNRESKQAGSEEEAGALSSLGEPDLVDLPPIPERLGRFIEEKTRLKVASKAPRKAPDKVDLATSEAERQVDTATSEAERQVDPATGEAERQVDRPTSGAERQVDPATSGAECQDTSTSLSADVEHSGTIKMTSTGNGESKEAGSEEEAGALSSLEEPDVEKTRPTVGSKAPGKSPSLSWPEIESDSSSEDEGEESLPEMESDNGSASEDEDEESLADEGEKSLPEIESDNDSAWEDQGEESLPEIESHNDSTFRAPGQRSKTAPLQIPAWSKSIPMPRTEQLEFALGMAIGLDTMDKLKNGEQVEITLRQDMSHASCHQGQFYAGLRSDHAFLSMLVFARQDPVLWMVAAWIHGAFNVHAPPTHDWKKPDDISEPDMTTLVAIVSPNAREPMQLPWGNVQWMVDSGTLDRHLLAEANREAFCLERRGNKWSKAATLGDFCEEPWVSGHPLCAAMVGHRAWDDISVSCAISRLLDPARTASELQQIRRLNGEMMDAAATRSICTDIQLRLDESYLACWLRQAPAALVQQDSSFYVHAAGQLVSGPAAGPKVDFGLDDPGLAAKVLAVIRSLGGDHPASGLGTKRGNEQVDTPETPPNKRLR